MSFVNWLKDICEPLGSPQQEDSIPAMAILWTHPVTGTHYYLDADMASRITRQGLAMTMILLEKRGATAVEDLSDFLAQRDIFKRKLWLEKNSFFTNEQIYTDNVGTSKIPLAAIWPELPFPGWNTIKQARNAPPSGWLRGERNPCVRLADFLLLRTGLFYALVGKELPSEEWPALRLTGLLEGSNFFAPQNDLNNLKLIPDILLSIYYAASWLAGYPEEFNTKQGVGQLEVDIVEGGTFKIKEYYLETNRISEIRGASVLLDDINRTRYVQMFLELPDMTLESIIYSGGGRLMAVVPVSEGKTVAGEIERLHREVCLTARAYGVSCTVAVSELAKKFPDLRGRLAEKTVARRSVLVPTWGTTEGTVDLYKKGFSLTAEESLLSAKPEEICSSCGIRQAFKKWRYEDEERSLCVSCLRKQLVGQSAKKELFPGEFKLFWKVRGEDVFLRSAGEINEIADDDNEIAVIYADGNNFGSLFGQCGSLAELRLLSQFSENAAYTAVFTALKENKTLLGGRSVEIIALGGDDIFLLVPARSALPLAVDTGENFDRLFKNISSHEVGPTLSLGVIIAAAKTPVQYLFDMARTLLKEAKKRVYKSDNSIREGTLDIAVLSSYATFQDNIVDYRKSTLEKEDVNYLKMSNRTDNADAGANKNILTMRPYTFSEARRIMEAVCQLKAASDSRAPGRGWFYGLRAAAEQYSRQVAELFFHYQFARLTEVQRETLRNSWRKITGSCSEPGMFFTGSEGAENNHYYPWLDIVELWNYVGEGGDVW